MILKTCKRCGNLIPYGKTYCSSCAPIAEVEREERRITSKRAGNRRYNKKRDPKYIQFYRSKEWKALSRARLQGDGYRCVKCGAIATEVDHIEPIQTDKGWNKRLDYDNTQSLCNRCHNIKHNRFNKRTS